MIQINAKYNSLNSFPYILSPSYSHRSSNSITTPPVPSIKSIKLQYVTIQSDYLNMSNQTDVLELSNIFKNVLDPEGKGFITKQQFITYMNQQVNKIALYHINDLFAALPQQKMDEKSFVIVALGARNGLENLAILRLRIAEQTGDIEDASPIAGPIEIKESSVDFKIEAGKQVKQGDKNRFEISIGKNSAEQQEKFACYKQLLGHEPTDLIIMIKFKVKDQSLAIQNALQKFVEEGRSMLLEMMQGQVLCNWFEKLQIQVRSHGEFIYIFGEMDDYFINDSIQYLHEVLSLINPDSYINLRLGLQSQYLNNLLKEGLGSTLEDLRLFADLKMDSLTMKKIKKIFDKSVESKKIKPQSRFIEIILLLLEQINLEMCFQNSAALFSETGLTQHLSELQGNVQSIKDMQISEQIEGFIPCAGHLIQLLRQHGLGDGQICINLGEIHAKAVFHMQIQGLMDLLYVMECFKS